jgi:hypothetical protein
MLELSIGEKLDGLSLFPEEARLEQQVRFHHSIFRETIEVFEVEDRKSFLKGRAKPPFGKAALQGHLPALESGLDPSSRAGFLTLGSFAGGLSVARADSSTHPFFLLR